MGRSFASDNSAGVHREILRAIAGANEGHVPAYGDDPFTRSAEAAFRRQFGDASQVLFVYGGTGANVVGLRTVSESGRLSAAVIAVDRSLRTPPQRLQELA